MPDFSNAVSPSICVPTNRSRRGRNTDIPPIAGDQDDQGLREIVALSACADAYRVIIGDTMEKIRTEEHAERTRETRIPAPALPEGTNGGEESKAKSSAERLAPAVLGTAAGGVAALAGAFEVRDTVALGLASGALVWLATWGAAEVGMRRSKRRVSRELSTDVKWDVERLERDLPVLLKRVKDAGFAPIFVLDELDKTRDANAALEKFLKLSKHIVTDHAAFLFLTDRDYYEGLIAADNVDWGAAG